MNPQQIFLEGNNYLIKTHHMQRKNIAGPVLLLFYEQ